MPDHGNILAIYLVGGQVDRASDLWLIWLKAKINSRLILGRVKLTSVIFQRYNDILLYILDLTPSE